MKSIRPYLIFNGDCREALDFYADCLGGTIALLDTFAESPLKIADEYGDLIYNSLLIADGIEIMASDTVPEYPVEVGKNVVLFVEFETSTDLERSFEALKDGGIVLMEIEDQFGMLEDRYGIRWMLNVS